ncbi:hypothetical protein KIN20_023093 [Parelaphostrongylus tenuis]|uniref:Uncharacterized protein n=1 Tax=Parelaphostrongylus tenuis TaxID=148309 RepID=A0AAD5QV68_PARTN|nr:hypothetical protein KIN20_023093 [Parelaphostrongylus tenuis]
MNKLGFAETMIKWEYDMKKDSAISLELVAEKTCALKHKALSLSKIILYFDFLAHILRCEKKSLILDYGKDVGRCKSNYDFDPRVWNDKATETPLNISRAFGPRPAKEHIVLWWFKKVHKTEALQLSKPQFLQRPHRKLWGKHSPKLVLLRLHITLQKNSTLIFLTISTGVYCKSNMGTRRLLDMKTLTRYGANRSSIVNPLN